jgi:hypothetical protein
MTGSFVEAESSSTPSTLTTNTSSYRFPFNASSPHGSRSNDTTLKTARCSGPTIYNTEKYHFSYASHESFKAWYRESLLNDLLAAQVPCDCDASRCAGSLRPILALRVLMPFFAAVSIESQLQDCVYDLL